jgi:hypothetical protein
VRSSAPAGYSYNGNGVALKWGRFKWRRWVDGLQSQGVHRRRRTATSVGKRECGRNGDTREGRETASKERRISVERREPRADGLSGVGDMRRLAKKRVRHCGYLFCRCIRQKKRGNVRGLQKQSTKWYRQMRIQTKSSRVTHSVGGWLTEWRSHEDDGRPARPH